MYFPPESLSTVFGERLKDQVEERLKFYETGTVPRKNAEVMKEALEEHNAKVKLEKKGKKRKLEEAVNGMPTSVFYQHYIIIPPLLTFTTVNDFHLSALLSFCGLSSVMLPLSERGFWMFRALSNFIISLFPTEQHA